MPKLSNTAFMVKCGREFVFEKGREYHFAFAFDGHLQVLDMTTGNYVFPECLQQEG